MFGLFSSPKFIDPQLGEFQRSRGYWRGYISLNNHDAIPLIIKGDRKTPGTQALQIAHGLADQFAHSKSLIENVLFEHYTPYADALDKGELPMPDLPFPVITKPDQVWSHLSIVFVSVIPLADKLCTEFGCRTDWDEEHMLGARFQDNTFLELCGSVLPP
jgi:hypothetical protein